MPDPRHLAGQRGEDVTAAWLATLGWNVLTRRWRGPHGELDLVCRDPAGVLVAVEVKLRRTERTGAAVESVDQRRIRRLRRSLGSFLDQERLQGRPDLRIDLVTVTPAPDGQWRLARYPSIDGW
jgi:putative endonuclease